MTHYEWTVGPMGGSKPRWLTSAEAREERTRIIARNSPVVGRVIRNRVAGPKPPKNVLNGQHLDGPWLALTPAQGMQLREVVIRVPTSWKVEVIADDSGKWNTNAMRYSAREQALEAGSSLFSRWTSVRCWRVTPTLDPVHPAAVTT